MTRLRLTLDVLFHPDHRVDFDDRHRREWHWTDWGAAIGLPSPKSTTERTAIVVDTTTGEKRVLYDLDAVVAAVDDPSPSVILLCDQVFALVLAGNRLFHYAFARKEAALMVEGLDPVPGVRPSPDGRFAAFVRANDLYAIEIVHGFGGGKIRKIAGAGEDTRLTGRLDWVYQEEVYGRGKYAASWWSPDSGRLAFLEIDVSAVPMVAIAPPRGSDEPWERYRYPRAGEPNPRARVGIADVGSGDVRWVRFPGWESTEHLVVRVRWSDDSRTVACQVQDREQTRLDLFFVDAGTGDATLVHAESGPMPWITPKDAPWWLEDGTWLWPSERSGFTRIERYDASGEIVGEVTPPGWHVREIHAVIAESNTVCFSANRENSHSVQVCAVTIDDPGEVRILTPERGTHQPAFSKRGTYFIDVWSRRDRPPEITLHSPGKRLHTSPAATVLDRYDLGEVEAHTVMGPDGQALDATLIRPRDFDRTRRHPVLCYVYGGPGTPVVRDVWGGSAMLWHHMLASQGILVWMMDNRSARAIDAASAWTAHAGRGDGFGAAEFRDVEAGVAWLQSRPWVDPERLGIWGWSFGGYLAAYAMTHSAHFRAGIAGAAVTDWTLYDTVYTERYMGTPGRFAGAYRRSSILDAAANLQGKLLILHGTADDNVHVENSLRLVDVLQQARKDFELMLYPGARHAVEDAPQVYDLRRRMTEFLLANL